VAYIRTDSRGDSWILKANGTQRRKDKGGMSKLTPISKLILEFHKLLTNKIRTLPSLAHPPFSYQDYGQVNPNVTLEMSGGYSPLYERKVFTFLEIYHSTKLKTTRKKSRQ
jgi:hypothetical protein